MKIMCMITTLLINTLEKAWEVAVKKNKTFKIQIIYGYIVKIIINKGTEKDPILETVYELSNRAYYDQEDFFQDEKGRSIPRLVNTRGDMNKVIEEASDEEKIVERYARVDSSIDVVGVYKMRVYIWDLDYALGSPIPIPEFIKKNKNIVTLDGVENNMCFWACLAVAFGSRRDRYTRKAKELFESFYGENMDKKQLKEAYKNYGGIKLKELETSKNSLI